MLRLRFFLLLLLYCFSLETKLYSARNDTLFVSAIFRNEAPYLKEWIEFHRVVGVDHFILYNHLSEDDYLKVLQPYIEENIVTLIEWNIPYEGDINAWLPVQCSAYEDAFKRGRKATWIAFLDTDEFLFPTEKKNLKDFLKEFPYASAVVVNWQDYGTSNVAEIPKDRLMIEMLTYKGPVNYFYNRYVKSIVRPKDVAGWKTPHHPILKHKCFQFNTRGKQTFSDQSFPEMPYKARINHYWTRDEHFFHTVKVPRNNPWHPAEKAFIRKELLNYEEDLAIFPFIPALRERMFRETNQD